MKKIIFSLIILTSFIACKQAPKGANGIAYKTPVQYNDYIVERQVTLMKNIVAFTDIAQPYPDSARKMLNIYAKQTGGFINEIKGMPAYKGDSTLRDAAIKTFSFYKKVFEDDYPKILDLNENMTEANSVIANDIVSEIGKEEEKLDKAFHNAQTSFAEKNKMKLMDNEMQKKVDALNKDKE